MLRVYLKYGGTDAAIRDLARVSRPGCRVYVGRDEIKRVQGGLGISILTTPKGVMTDRQALAAKAWVASCCAKCGKDSCQWTVISGQ